MVKCVSRISLGFLNTPSLAMATLFASILAINSKRWSRWFRNYVRLNISYWFSFKNIKINFLFFPTFPTPATLIHVASVDDVGFLKTFIISPPWNSYTDTICLRCNTVFYVHHFWQLNRYRPMFQRLNFQWILSLEPWWA